MKNRAKLILLTAILYIACGCCIANVDTALLLAAQSRQPSFEEDLQTLVNIDSGTGDQEGLAQLEGFLTKRLKRLGAKKVEIRPAPPAVGNVVVGSFQGDGTKNFMLMIHYDTVFEKGEAAERRFKTEGNKAFGPGVADAKGGVVIILHALDIMRQRGFRSYKTLTVLFNPDEEKSSLGSREIIRQFSSWQDVVLSYEPPKSEQVIVATNGIARIHLHVTGKAAHGSRPEEGRNAAVELAHQVLKLNDLGNPAKGTTVAWTMIQAGNKNDFKISPDKGCEIREGQAGNKDHVNTIPELACAIADMRMSNLTELKRVRQDANKIIQNKLIPKNEVTVKVEYRRPPFSKNQASDHLATVANGIYEELEKTIEPVVERYGTDAGFAYNPDTNKPAILEGMGIVGDGIHTDKEWADLDSVPNRLYLTVRMLEILAARRMR